VFPCSPAKTAGSTYMEQKSFNDLFCSMDNLQTVLNSEVQFAGYFYNKQR